MENKKYKVRFYQDDIYEVYEDNECVYQGSLSNCEAYIRLHENGYM